MSNVPMKNSGMPWTVAVRSRTTMPAVRRRDIVTHRASGTEMRTAKTTDTTISRRVTPRRAEMTVATGSR
jgi:IS4 transposase